MFAWLLEGCYLTFEASTNVNIDDIPLEAAYKSKADTSFKSLRSTRAPLIEFVPCPVVSA